MKELSIEEKAKRYDKAIEVAQRFYNNSVAITKKGLEDIFPELVESEGEKIRNFISNELACLRANYGKGSDRYEELTNAIAWLEKQGKNSMGISEATKQELEDNLNKALGKETPESCNEFLEKQGEQTPADITDKLKEEYQKGWDAAMLQLPKEVDSQIWQIANNSAITWDESFAILCATQKAYDKGKKDALKEQSFTWSKEDDITLLDTINILRSCGKCSTDRKLWLLSLKDRVQPQPKQEWSEQEQVRINRIVACLENLNVADNDILLKDVAWLKSLRPQNHWKPSDEQMEALEHFVRSIGESGYACPYDNNTKLLYLLLSDLKKLKA